jgi:hypothetical protein
VAKPAGTYSRSNLDPAGRQQRQLIAFGVTKDLLIPGVHDPLQRRIMVFAKQQRALGKAVLRRTTQIFVERHLRFQPPGRIEAERQNGLGLVVDALALVMPEARQRGFRRREKILEKPVRSELQPHGVVDVQAPVVLREIDVRQRLQLFRGPRRIQYFARQQFDLPEIRTQFRIVGEANEIDSVPLIGEIIEQFGVAEQAGVDHAFHKMNSVTNTVS